VTWSAVALTAAWSVRVAKQEGLRVRRAPAPANTSPTVAATTAPALA
jgi:hypothetical protein